MTHPLAIGAQIFGLLLLADLLSGIIHWVQDRYQRNDDSLLSRVVILNAKTHHTSPDSFTKASWKQRNFGPCLVAAIPVVITGLAGGRYWQGSLLALMLLISGQVHYWAHIPRGANWRLVSIAQTIGLIQSQEHHAKHHAATSSHYCVLTNVMNPLLEQLRFFQTLEWVLSKSLRVEPLP